MSHYPSSYFFGPDTKTATVSCFTDPLGQACLLGGCKNVGESLYGSTYNTSLSQKSQIDALFNDDNATTIDHIFLHMVKFTYGGTVVAAVPDHGYLAQSDTEISSAWGNATSSSHTLLSDMDPNDVYLIAGDFRNGPTGSVILGAYIGKIVNPDYYSNIDPIEIHNYYINHWLGISDYDVSDDGEFIYHPLN
jgi:iron complex transport system substrate-binding protein